MDKKSPIDTVSLATKIYDKAFAYQCNLKQTKKYRDQIIKILKLKGVNSLKKFTAMLYCYCGDTYRASQMLKPSLDSPADIDLLIFDLLLQATALKVNAQNFLYLRDAL